MSTANRKYKDSVFVDLFSEDEKVKENFLSLYNALRLEYVSLNQKKNIAVNSYIFRDLSFMSFTMEKSLFPVIKH